MRCLVTAHDTHEGGPVPPQRPSLRQKNRSPQLFCKRLFIDIPARSPDLEYRVFHGIHAQSENSIEYITYIHVENTGKGESLEDRAYVLVKFYGIILKLSEPWSLPIGSRFVDENNREIVSCIRRSVCKLVLGNLVSNGRVSVGFISNNTLIDLPQISYGGLLSRLQNSDRFGAAQEHPS